MVLKKAVAIIIEHQFRSDLGLSDFWLLHMSEPFLIITSQLATSVHVQRLMCVLLLLASLGTRAARLVGVHQARHREN